MATKSLPIQRVPVAEEWEIVYIDVKLSGRDLANVRRILEGRFEPQEDAWLSVKVKKKTL
jgi:hypothetical protein